MTTTDLYEQVRERYAEAARTASRGQVAACGDLAARGPESSCCGSAEPASKEGFGAARYDAIHIDGLPDTAVLASLGCGNPTAVAELRVGERVLDLGSGGGIDALLSAKWVGPTGFVYGVDMTDEMLELARRSIAEAGVANIEFR